MLFAYNSCFQYYFCILIIIRSDFDATIAIDIHLFCFWATAMFIRGMGSSSLN